MFLFPRLAQVIWYDALDLAKLGPKESGGGRPSLVPRLMEPQIAITTNKAAAAVWQNSQTIHTYALSHTVLPPRAIRTSLVTK